MEKLTSLLISASLPSLRSLPPPFLLRPPPHPLHPHIQVRRVWSPHPRILDQK